MQRDPEALQKMAKQMGYNLNKQQMAKAQQLLNKNTGGRHNRHFGGRK
ncbi:hypothetical protein PACILC2_45920 [Paenibacillus cisolokensis]|uniref:Uncharacterized protein n=2 Tax=Paenibacillus TaxID=44249 RepID=A0ABQ4NCS9_9BACL|nr:hypothetical protein PACILC2_45920 [Paenibacillus cisolokensis]